MFGKILVAVGGDDASLEPARVGGRLAGLLRAQLTLLSVKRSTAEALGECTLVDFEDEEIGDFVGRHPTVKMLALAFLVAIGVMLIADGFGPGYNGPFLLAATTDDPGDAAAVQELAVAIDADPGVANVSPPFPNDLENPQESEAFVLRIIPTTSPQDEATEATVQRLRDDVIPPIVEGTGIQLNNMLGEEDLNPFGFHATGPGRRMPSMMSPTRYMVSESTLSRKSISISALQPLVR